MKIEGELMKTLLASFLVLVFSFSVEAQTRQDIQALKIGDSMPLDRISESDAKMKGVDGKTLDLRNLRGKKGTLINFTCNHCPFVVGWQERKIEIVNRYVDDLNVIFINPNDPAGSMDKEPILRDDMAGMKLRAKAQGMKFPYVIDATSNVARAFGATRTPEIFLFNAEGKLVYMGAPTSNFEGGEGDIPVLDNAIKAMLAGETIDQPVTRAVGCTIKFRRTES